ncbi:MinD/ParA family ATP-binding protein [Glutamicibacter sp. AOP5-A2-18]|uniref:MinD/ParA family ATP-binding protein n=1 Tax=Glutamicibacter sp. AOP5-A2-18 TaxID=3457656 RepID=UPI00403385B3
MTLETETQLYSVSVEPLEFRVRAPYGTSITHTTWKSVLRTLRKQRSAMPQQVVHAVMDPDFERWAIDGWMINAQAAEGSTQDVLLPLENRLKSSDVENAFTVSVTAWQLQLGERSTTYKKFTDVLDAAKDFYSTNHEDDEPGRLVMDSGFIGIDRVEFAGPERPEPVVEHSVTEPAGEQPAEVPAAEQMQASSDASTALAQVEEAPADPGLEVQENENLAVAFATRMEARKQATAPACKGFPGWMNRVFHTKLAPGEKEQFIRELHALVQRSLSEHRTIALGNIKGGAAKSTIVYLLCAILGRFRGGNILLWDNNENAGNIVDRAIVPPQADIKTTIDLYREIDKFENAELSHLLKRYVLMQGDNRFYLLPSQNQAGSKKVIDGPAFNSMYQILRRFYDLMVVDTGNASNSGPWEASMNASDLTVIASSNAEDGFRGSLKTIEALKKDYPDKLANAVVVFSEIIETKYSNLTTQEFVDQIKDDVREVVVIPFDKELVHGGKITFDALEQKTQEAYLRAAAAVLGGLN